MAWRWNGCIPYVRWPSLRSSNVFLPWVGRSAWISHCRQSSDSFLLQPVTSICQLTAVEASAQRISSEGFIGNHQEFCQIGGGPDTFACWVRRSGRCCKAGMQHENPWSVKQFPLKFARTWNIKRSETNTQSDFFHLTRKSFGAAFPLSFQSLALKQARNSRTCLQESPSKLPQSWDFHRQEISTVDLGMELWIALRLAGLASDNQTFLAPLVQQREREKVRAGEYKSEHQSGLPAVDSKCSGNQICLKSSQSHVASHVRFRPSHVLCGSSKIVQIIHKLHTTIAVTQWFCGIPCGHYFGQPLCIYPRSKGQCTSYSIMVYRYCNPSSDFGNKTD